MKPQIVSFHCIVKNRMGRVISKTFNQGVITQVEGRSDMLKGLADGLNGLRKGEKRQILLPAEEAYGLYDPQLVIEVARSDIDRGSKVTRGAEVLTQFDEDESPRVFRVVEADQDSVTLDGNHPLAGQDLVFDIEATEARDATSEEIADSVIKDQLNPSSPGETLH